MPDRNIYTVGWICALEIELVAAASFLDDEHEDADDMPDDDNNSYVLGRIGKHNVTIAALPNGQYGLVSAATVARDMVRSFPNVRIGLMVGIGGGVPSSKHDIRLGDIVVSSPESGSVSGGVYQYDYGRSIQDSDFIVTGHLNQPPQLILTAMSNLRAHHTRRGHNIESTIEDVLARNTRLQADFRKPDATTDRLYYAAYTHAGAKEAECILSCDALQLARNPEQSGTRDSPTIHYGIIASANQLMRDANLRDKLSAKNDVLCFEMEAAGLMNQFPCVVVRGICDYSDTHKNKVWQRYAAMAAAAYAKELLNKIAPNRVEAKRKLIEFLHDVKEEVKEEIHAVSRKVDDAKSYLRAANKRQHLDDVTNWLAAPDVSSNLNRATKARYPGSGQRLINNEAYREWRTRSNSFLWLHGIPGCGKTVLTSTVINDLSDSQVVYYFYFDFTDTRKQTFENCIRSLLSQMYHMSERGREEVCALYECCRKGNDQPSEGDLQETFAKIIRNGKTWLVIDALDECKVRDSLLLWLRDIRHNDAEIHVIATSRPEQDIDHAMKKICCGEREKIVIDGDLLEADINNYVRAIIAEDDDFLTWRSMPEIQGEIEAALVSKANGMFRWVCCQLSALKKCKDPISLRSTLAALPKDLDETYARILANIPPEYSDHTLRVLQFLTYSERPLQIEEAVDMIAVRLGPGVTKGSRFNVRDRMPTPTDIVGYLHSLAVVVTKGPDHSIRQELQLAHFSVKDYLTSDRLKDNISACFQEKYAQSVITEVCLAYLLEILPNEWIEDSHSWLTSTLQYETTEDIARTFHFARYSAQYWASHFALVEYHSETAFNLAKELLLDRAQMKHCLSFRWMLDEDDWPSLHYVSFFGWKRCCKMLLDEGVDINERGEPHGNAVYAALHGGHQEIVDILLRKGADPNPPRRTNHSLLWLAVKEGHEDRVRLLLDSGAQVDVSGDSERRTPLSLAVSHGFKAITRMLLDSGAQVNAPGDSERHTPLSLAVSHGFEDITRMLLDSGAQVDVSGDSERRTPLSLAVSHGFEAITRMLLEHGAQVECVDDKGCTPLATASEQGHIEIMTDLLGHGAKVNGFVEKLEIPVILACRNGQTRAAELLIRHGAYINGILRSVDLVDLFDANKKAYRKVLELLLVAEGGLRLEDRFGRSLLTMATIHNKPEIVDVLLTAPDLDVNAKDHWGATAISFAARYGFTEIFRKIAALPNVDFDAEDGCGRTPLWWAKTQRHNNIASDIIKRLQRQNDDKSVQFQMPDASAGLGPKTFGTAFRVYDEYCVVCLATLEDYGPRYECLGCARDDGRFICEVCYELGARLVGSHLLLFIDPKIDNFDSREPFDPRAFSG